MKLASVMLLCLTAGVARADPPAAEAPEPPVPVQQPTQPQPQPHAAPPRAAPMPRSVDRGGGAGRMFAWTSMLLGITGGLAAGGLYFYAQNQLDSCQQHTLLGLGCESERQQANDATGFATLGGISAGALVGTSIVLFIVTEPRHTEIVYDDPAHPPEPAGLPIGGYVATGVALGAAITAHVMMSNAAGDLADPARHPTPDGTASLVSRYHYTRYAAGGLYLASAGFAAMAAIDTVRVLRRQARGEQLPQLSLAPITTGAVLTLGGRF